MDSKAPTFVEVLLATYNGEKYLAEQLDSLLAQEDVNISLLVSDDGSSDRTLEILETYKTLFPEFRLLAGPQNGPQANFFYLLANSRREFIALCDQDDIWETDHLKNSLTRLTPRKPSVTFSPVQEFSTEHPGKNRIWPKKIRLNRIENILFENPARGCTLVMNREFIEIIINRLPESSIMHDWWIALIGLSYECISAGAKPEVKYRIHSNNAVGPTPGILTKSIRLGKILTAGSIPATIQVETLYKIHSFEIVEQTQKALLNWIRPVSIKALLRQVFSATRYRGNLLEEVVLRFTFVWVWLIGNRRS